MRRYYFFIPFFTSSETCERLAKLSNMSTAGQGGGEIVKEKEKPLTVEEITFFNNDVT
jgi:hypothetical protein